MGGGRDGLGARRRWWRFHCWGADVEGFVLLDREGWRHADVAAGCSVAPSGDQGRASIRAGQFQQFQVRVFHRNEKANTFGSTESFLVVEAGPQEWQLRGGAQGPSPLLQRTCLPSAGIVVRPPRFCYFCSFPGVRSEFF